MTLENNFKEHSKKYIFSNNNILSKEREATFKKISSNNFEKRNNESLKNITFSDLSLFKYFYEPPKESTNIKVLNNKRLRKRFIHFYRQESIQLLLCLVHCRNHAEPKSAYLYTTASG